MQTDHSRTNPLHGVLAGIALALVGAIGTIGMLREIGEFGPRVGDIVSFDPLERLSADMKTRVVANVVGGTPGGTCVLDVQIMYATGGSVVIEMKAPEVRTGYRVHWAGPRTSDGGTDCGQSNDLLLDREDIEALAMAAGGYGAVRKKFVIGSLLGSGIATVQ